MKNYVTDTHALFWYLTQDKRLGRKAITDVLLFEQLISIPEMHDRIIAGVAKKLDAPCLTKDKEIRQGDLVKTIW